MASWFQQSSVGRKNTWGYRMKSRVFWLGVVLLLSLAAWGQDSASITGTVTDQSGAAVPNAQVTVSSLDRGINRPTTTNATGDYLVAGLPSGPVNVTVVAQGFKRYEAKAIVLQVGQKARADVALEVGTIKEEVTVEGANVAQVETQSSDLTGTVNGKQITQLQLNGRNFTQLVTLVPGVSNQTGQDEGTVGINGNVSFSINGGRVEYNNWELDGGDNMDNGSNSTLNVYPSLEAIAEFKVLTSNYGAQYGRNGSGTVEVETKSGTNGFHGNAYEFLRNDALNSTKYFLDSVSPYKKNDFGYTIGGPIIQNKTFFFWSQEWRRDRVPADFNQAVPSVEERAGDFTDQCSGGGSCPSVGADLLAAGYNPSDPTVQALLGMIPLPTTGTGLDSRYRTSLSLPTNWREELIRVDHNFTDKIRGTVRYIHDSWDTVTDVPLWTNAGSFPTIQTAFKGPGVSLVARLNATFSPTLLNEFVAPEGFQVESAADGTRGLEMALHGEFLLVVLDVMLPGLNGFEVLRRLRDKSRIPVLLLTARGEDVDRIVGLEIGADDYLPKPFNPRELVARIRAILRRTRSSERSVSGQPAEILRVGEVELDPATRTVLQKGKLVELTSVEFNLLHVLLREAGRVVPRERLVDIVLSRKFSPFDRSIDMHVSKIRKKLGESDSGVDHIKTVRGVGYIFTRPQEVAAEKVRSGGQ